MLINVCKVKAMFRGLWACAMEENSMMGTQKDALHGNNRTSSSIMLLVVLVQLVFGFLEQGQSDSHSH